MKNTYSCIVASGMTIPKLKSGETATNLMKNSIHLALNQLNISDVSLIDGLIAMPSLSEPRFMQGHYLATELDMFRRNNSTIIRTLDVGGASPVSALIQADFMIKYQDCHLVAICSGDAVSTMPTDLFLKSADRDFNSLNKVKNVVPSPVIPNAYDLIAQHFINNGYIKRNHLAMASSILSKNALKHPSAITKSAYSLQDILDSKQIGKVTTILETARRIDGGITILVASNEFAKKHLNSSTYPRIAAYGESSGPLYHDVKNLGNNVFSCRKAFQQAKAMYEKIAQQSLKIDYYSIYDCFPICFLLGIDSVGISSKPGDFIEDIFHRYNENSIQSSDFPINTHGGLMHFGAPWEVPAMYGIVEAVDQLQEKVSSDRQIRNCNTSLVYGNGGIFSSSAIAILTKD